MLKKNLLKYVFIIRAGLKRRLFPIRADFSALERKTNFPASRKCGFDRGRPIDRYYIERFLSENQADIKGVCLEIHDAAYLKRFGQGRVEVFDVLDIDRQNKEANIYGDLRKLDNVFDSTYDCIILTQTLGMIDDFEAAIRECFRILKPGGVILATSSALAPCLEPAKSFWRFTEASFAYSFGKYFKPDNLSIIGLGNCRAGQAFWAGLAQEDLKPEELAPNDRQFPVIIALRGVK